MRNMHNRGNGSSNFPFFEPAAATGYGVIREDHEPGPAERRKQSRRFSFAIKPDDAAEIRTEPCSQNAQRERDDPAPRVSPGDQNARRNTDTQPEEHEQHDRHYEFLSFSSWGRR